jgi:hypothetical protein
MSETDNQLPNDFDHIKIPNERMLEEMIIEEEKRRNSYDYRFRCTEVKDTVNGWLDVTDNMQKDVVISFGFYDKISQNIACNMMRRAHIIYPDNELFKTVPLQVRNNKAIMGSLKISDEMPDATIFDINLKSCSLSSLIVPDKPNIIIMSSGT